MKIIKPKFKFDLIDEKFLNRMKLTGGPKQGGPEKMEGDLLHPANGLSNDVVMALYKKKYPGGELSYREVYKKIGNGKLNLPLRELKKSMTKKLRSRRTN